MVQLSFLRMSGILVLGAALVSSTPISKPGVRLPTLKAINRREVMGALDIAVAAPPQVNISSTLAEAKLVVRAEEPKLVIRAEPSTADASELPLPSVSRRQSSFIFPELPYSQFQISSTPGGIAAQEAAAQFIVPFNGVDLATVSKDVENALANMREAAEAAELDLFNPAIDAASGVDASALQVGKTKNKVLKHTIFLQIINIRLAKARAEGEDTTEIEADLVDRQKKLATNTALDRENRGKASKGVA